MTIEQIQKLESYFTDRFKTLLDGKMLNLQIESHRDANAIKQEYCTWGDGDSLDRERVRDILLDEFGYTHKEGTW